MHSHLEALIAVLAGHPGAALAAVFAAAALEAVAVVGTVVPGSTVVFAGGMLVGLGALDFRWAFAVAVCGAILGDGVSYWLGHRHHEKLRGLWPLKGRAALLERGQAYFAANGRKSVFVARFLGPLRAIVPVAAGIAGMPARDFYVANVLSALAWAGVHLLPGMLFGASLQLAGAVSSRLLVLLAMLAALLWGLARLARAVFGYGSPRILALRDRLVRRARERAGLPSRAVLAFFDPQRPESPALLTAAAALIGGAWLFLGVLQDVVSNDPLVQVDRTVYEALQGLRTSWGDSVMVAITDLGGAAATIGAITAVALLLALRRRWRTLGYWLGAAAFAEGLVWVLKETVGRARPAPVYAGHEQLSFPSGHAALAIVVYGFLAFLLARGKSAGWKAAIAFGTATAIALVAFSRLYLGAHWLSDVAASLAFGLAWVALLAIAYTHHVRDEPLRAPQLAAAALIGLALAGGTYVRFHHAADLERYAYRPAPQVVPLAEWQTGGWRALPAARSELSGEAEEPFSVQWAATSAQVSSTLAAAGWQPSARWAGKALLLWLLPDPDVRELPVLPKLDRGAPAQLTFVKPQAPGARLVLRLWRSGRLVGGEPLWHGTASAERLRHPAGLITLSRTEPDFAAPVSILEGDLHSQGWTTTSQRARAGAVLLAWRP